MLKTDQLLEYFCGSCGEPHSILESRLNFEAVDDGGGFRTLVSQCASYEQTAILFVPTEYGDKFYGTVRIAPLFPGKD